jgi:hypothetical protein
MIASSRELSLAHVNSVASGHLARNRPPWHECIAGSAVFVVNAVTVRVVSMMKSSQ